MFVLKTHSSLRVLVNGDSTCVTRYTHERDRVRFFVPHKLSYDFLTQFQYARWSHLLNRLIRMSIRCSGPECCSWPPFKLGFIICVCWCKLSLINDLIRRVFWYRSSGHISCGHGPGGFCEDDAFCKAYRKEKEIRSWDPISSDRIIIMHFLLMVYLKLGLKIFRLYRKYIIMRWSKVALLCEIFEQEGF